jgi:hypothetical protein
MVSLMMFDVGLMVLELQNDWTLEVQHISWVWSGGFSVVFVCFVWVDGV